MGEKKEHLSHIPTRLNILFFIVFLFFAAIILRLAFVQLVEGEQYKHALEKYSTRELPIAAPRGRILDRNGEVLVSNKPVYTVTYVEEQNQSIDEEEVADKLARILNMDGEKTGTDKELLKLALDLQATLPVAFGPKETEKLIAQIEPKLKALPTVAQVDALDNRQLVKTASAVGLKARVTLDSKDRELIKNSLKGTVKNKAAGQPAVLAEIPDSELLKYALQANLPFKISFTSEERDGLIKEVKAQLRMLPDPASLREKSDMDLLRYAAMLDIDVPLPLTDQQRRFQWHKLNILKEMRSYNIASYIPRRVKVNISEKEMFMIEERRNELPGVSVVLEPIRQIREEADGTTVGTHFLGYIKPIPPDQVEEYKAQGYNPFDQVGITNLEKYYERYLRGKDGVMEVHVNKDSETIEKRERQAPQPGDDLVLALDWRFQSRVEQILKTNFEAMKKNPAYPKEMKDAHALVMDPNTGEILAMASYPDYNLNWYYDRKTFNEKWETQILPNEANRFIGSAYPPGSTVKPISVMLALQEKLTTPNETIFDRGGLKVGNVFMRNWKAGGHGPVNARRALQVSNNTYMYEMAVRFARRAKNSYKEQFSVLDFYNAQFGLGVKTGVDLPYESSGWENPNDYYGNLAHAFIGQYDLFTPMQLGQYVCTIANGGYRIRPHFVREIREGSNDPKKPGKTLMKFEPEVLNKIQIDPQWLKLAQEGMHMVTLPGGTASRAFAGLPFNVAAKTGTAQTGKRTDNALLIGYAPYEHPKVAFVVIIPNGLLEGAHSSDASGPIARQILEAYNELYPGELTGQKPSQPAVQK
ncbi:penicillin-binding protein [Brevibacillus sp. SYP-B805]|uniref:peptidoglycan D,D-transpeptidase FtsI family protein n=1 Tax=Brevibacillus sp. SYP-B805 TaxID=1578199 RepID=UPI0013ECE654|nr:penicillin-binding transpeptidase domain-containing protein [Brevibacillus sp. SYP-B805]NGQ94307.1 penicillin-binding protein [Brevibacillus sp. SYP-B805]